MEEQARPNNDKMQDIYGYCGHRCVLYASRDGEIVPGDLAWHSADEDFKVNGFTYDELRPVAIVVSQSSDKCYRDNLQEALLIPASWSYEIVWLDESWFAANKGLLVRNLGWQDGMRGGVTTASQYIAIDAPQYDKGFEEGQKHKLTLARQKAQ